MAMDSALRIPDNPANGLPVELPPPTLLRIKRRRNEDAVEAFVVEAEQPEKKKRRLEELSKALEGLDVAKELHSQFNQFLSSNRNNGFSDQDNSVVNTVTNSFDNLPDPSWIAPNQTLQSKLRRIFHFIGSEDMSNQIGYGKNVILNDLINGKSDGADALRARLEGKSSGTPSSSSQPKPPTSFKSYYIQKVEEFEERNGLITEDGSHSNVKMLELVPANPLAAHHTPTGFSRPGAVTLPVIKCSRELQLQAEKKKMKNAMEADYVVDYYLMAEDPFIALTSFQSVHIPLAEFKTHLLDDYVLEGEYSDEDNPYESDDSQNRSEEWEYGSDPDDDVEFGSDPAPEDDAYESDNDYHEGNKRMVGYDLEIDPREDHVDYEDFVGDVVEDHFEV